MSNNAAPLWLYCREIGDQSILYGPKEINGPINQPYHIQPGPLKGHDYIGNSGSLSGRLGPVEQSLTLYYQPVDWYMSEQISLVLETIAKTSVYPTPDLHTAIIGQLPAASRWASLLKVTKHNHEIWFQIERNQWVHYSAAIINIQSESVPAKNAMYQNQPINNRPTQLNATIDFLPNQSISYFDQPYGLSNGQLKDGELVIIDQSYLDENNVTWCHIYDHGWINGLYIRKFN